MHKQLVDFDRDLNIKPDLTQQMQHKLQMANDTSDVDTGYARSRSSQIIVENGNPGQRHANRRHREDEHP